MLDIKFRYFWVCVCAFLCGFVCVYVYVWCVYTCVCIVCVHVRASMPACVEANVKQIYIFIILIFRLILQN